MTLAGAGTKGPGGPRRVARRRARNVRCAAFMCGISGVLYRDGAPADAGVLEHMIGQLKHRGPDGFGVKCFRGVGLAHARLSVIDLSDAAAQPLTTERGRAWVVFNGEIYNFRALRAE